MELPFIPKKSLSQNFVTNPMVAKWMADAAELKAGDSVLEIGPGTGALTKTFLERGARVTAVEADARAVVALRETFEDEIANGNFVLHHGDVRNFDLRSTGLSCGNYKLLANIPYHLSGILFRMFLAGDCQPNTLVFLTQKEVAERIVGNPEQRRGTRPTKESLLSLSIKAYGEPRYVKTVTRGNFRPQPKVDSAIIAVTDISKKHFENTDELLFFELLHVGFASRRKQLLGAFAKHYDRDTLTQIFSTLNITPDARGEDIPLETWLELTDALSMHR